MIRYEDFPVEQVSIELRFEPAFAIWDRAGEMWGRLRSQFPDLRYQSASPHQQIFENSESRVTFELEKFLVQSRGQKPVEVAAPIAQAMLEACSDLLRISVFTRVGFREIRAKQFQTIAEALAAAGDAAPLTFARKSAPSFSPVAFASGMRQEGETAGLGIYVRGEERQINVQIPWEVAHKFKQESTKEYMLMLDSDYFTVGTTPRSALDVEEWAKQAGRSIRRAWGEILT